MLFRSDCIVIGGGHAGIEASLAAARMGCKTALLTTDIETIGMMPCNPSIGGPAKGQIVGEIDALGGEMGKAADNTFIQIKVLNRSRGPAVQCLRTQNDKPLYSQYMKTVVQSEKNLYLIQAEADSLLVENKTIKGIRTRCKKDLLAITVVITTGTFLKGLMHTGMQKTEGGRLDEQSANHLSGSLGKYLKLGRLKTGTPPRLDKKSIDYDVLVPQPGDNEFLRFSFLTPYNTRHQNQEPCFLTRTTPKTHDIILKNLDRSPLFTKVIQGVGPRYCPSIEDKIVRFQDKESHHIFIEPESRSTQLIYPQGLNTSLPADVQEEFLKTMPGLEQARIIRHGYAVEYDFIYPNQLKHSLETHAVKHLFSAGQINGTSGYEEAAGQGIIAGINAARAVQKKPPLILHRNESFIGTLIDDLIRKDIYEPYRMLTSRAEYRLLLRQDNAIFRLSKAGYDVGLLTKANYQQVLEKKDNMNALIKHWKKTATNLTQTRKFKLKQRTPYYNIIKRPEITITTLLEEGIVSRETKDIAEKAVIEIKYEGYIQKQELEIKKTKKFESRPLPKDINYKAISGLKKESQDKLNKYRPKTILEAQRIAGINPADILVLIATLEKQKENQGARHHG